ncbi:hypothetical protein D3C76_952970 [compost metagenome]
MLEQFGILLQQVCLLLLQAYDLLHFAVALTLQAGNAGIHCFQHFEQARCGFAQLTRRALQALNGERFDDHPDGSQLSSQAIDNVLGQISGLDDHGQGLQLGANGYLGNVLGSAFATFRHVGVDNDQPMFSGELLDVLLVLVERPSQIPDVASAHAHILSRPGHRPSPPSGFTWKRHRSEQHRRCA